MPSKVERRALNARVATRFPKGSAKGDTLSYVIPLGSQYRQVNSLTFGSKSTKPQGFKAFSKV